MRGRDVDGRLETKVFVDITRYSSRDRLNTGELHHTYSMTVKKRITGYNKPHPESWIMLFPPLSIIYILYYTRQKLRVSREKEGVS